ncbi:DEAD-box ATP-dependent RNA helicase 28-like protein [Drosera capensis]
MDSGFVFEAPSDEELEEYESEYDEDENEGISRLTRSPSPRSTSVVARLRSITRSRKLVNNVEDKLEEAEDQENAVVDSKSFFAPSEGVSFHAKSFMELNLSCPLLRTCEALGCSKPTPIQAACIPLALTGRDICGSAVTGSSKTAAFALPTLERLFFRPKRVAAIRVLMLTSARELAVQIHSMIEKVAQFMDIRCCIIIGGLSSKVQEAALRSMPDVVVATPGRILDHLRNSMSVDLDSLAVLILDEADRLLELGFREEVHEIIRLCPKRRQSMLFSATMTEDVQELVKLSMTKPLRLSADPSAKRPASLTEEVIRIRRTREAHQEAILLSICSRTFISKVIIFSGTKQAAHRLKILFGLVGLKAAELHGNPTQAQRLDALESFRKQEVDFLIATDVAARGLDIVGVQTVINFDCPRNVTSYVHRVGRTARAGRKGYAVTFVPDKDWSLIKEILRKAHSKAGRRTVAEQSINKWVQMIEEMEDQVSAILQEEKEEMALRKAEMEAVKASKETDKTSSKHLPRKKRRRLEAAREMLEDEARNLKESNKKGKKERSGIPLVDVAYRRAKAIKAGKRAQGAGRSSGMKEKKVKHSQSRTEEMKELFQSDMSEKQPKRNLHRTGMKPKSSFKSKSRYKRR